MEQQNRNTHRVFAYPQSEVVWHIIVIHLLLFYWYRGEGSRQSCHQTAWTHSLHLESHSSYYCCSVKIQEASEFSERRVLGIVVDYTWKHVACTAVLQRSKIEKIYIKIAD